MALKYQDLRVGDVHEAVVVDDLTRTQLVQYCGAFGDYNALHSDEVYTTQVAGYPKIFAHAGEHVMDLGSGSGMDSFMAAVQVGPTGRVVGIDFTAAQLGKARRLAADAGVGNIEFREGRIDALPAEATDSVDCVISNGVINLSPDKELVFREAARVLRPGGRLAVADIVTEKQLTEAIVCNADLWASCIGGAAQQDSYRAAIERAGLRIEQTRTNPYQFISDQALGASATYGVHSVSILAVKPVH
jgi:ubiquinone/menaquinone biosynthesis C-methylase UbiE